MNSVKPTAASPLVGRSSSSINFVTPEKGDNNNFLCKEEQSDFQNWREYEMNDEEDNWDNQKYKEKFEDRVIDVSNKAEITATEEYNNT